MKTLIIIPAYNEAENIERTVTSLRQECPELDYIVKVRSWCAVSV